MSRREEIKHIKNLIVVKSAVLLNNIHKSIVDKVNETDCIVNSNKINESAVDINIVTGSKQNLDEIKDKIISIRNYYKQ